jgi:hypothetical protein
MINSNIWHQRFRLLFCFFFAIFLFFTLPDTLSLRLWIGALLFLLLPLLFLNQRGYLSKDQLSDLMLQVIPHERKFYFYQIFPHLIMVFILSLAVSHFHPLLTFLLWSWGCVFLTILTLLEKITENLGDYLLRSLTIMILVLSMPFWSALLFDHPSFESWLPNLVFNFHPVPAGLSITGKSVLQDPLMYQTTKSGLIDVRILPVIYGLIFNFIFSVLMVELTLKLKKQNRSF